MQVRLLVCFFGRGSDSGQQCLQLLQLLRAGRPCVHAGKHQSQVVLQPHADRQIERQRKNPRHRGLLDDAALVGVAIHLRRHSLHRCTADDPLLELPLDPPPEVTNCAGDARERKGKLRSVTSERQPLPRKAPPFRLILQSTSATQPVAQTKAAPTSMPNRL